MTLFANVSALGTRAHEMDVVSVQAKNALMQRLQNRSQRVAYTPLLSAGLVLTLIGSVWRITSASTLRGQLRHASQSLTARILNGSAVSH